MANLFDTLYIPGYQPEQIPLNDFISEGSLELELTPGEIVQRKINSRAEEIQSGQTKPLTAPEAEAIDLVIKGLQDKIVVIKSKVLGLRHRIDAEASPDQGKELQYRIDISKRPALKRAVRRVFGTKADTLTYSMYKEALEKKRQLEKEESDDYLGKD